MLELRQVSAGYGEGDVVREVSFSVAPNEALCIVGPNGCGKTTLLKAIAGLLPYRGEIWLRRQPLRGIGAKAIARHIALLSQTSGAYFPYSVYDTVMMARYAHMRDGLWGAPSRRDHEVVGRCLSAVDMLADQAKAVTQLSGGQLQRVFLARALAQEPEIILLDEPTNHLDFKYQVELIAYLQAWRKQTGKRVIGVLHDINLTLRLADRVLLMRDGAAVSMGPTREVVTRKALRELYQTDVTGFMLESLKQWQEIRD